jgi:EAL domain-containing protein (putative c-di-GMP-specific phosphodiesterase class I)
VQSVLIVDDDPEISSGLSFALERAGREIIVCSDIEAAELIVERRKLDCVVTDVRLTGPFRFEGLEFIGYVKRHSPDSTIVLMTGLPSDDLTREALARGATTVLEKPFELATLEELIGEPAPGPQAEVQTMPSIDDIVGSNDLVPMFQPIVDLTAGEAAHGYESLARYQSAGLLHAPDALFGYADRKGRTVDLELACLRATFTHCAPLAATGARIFVNVHPDVIGTGRLAATLDACVASYGVPALQIVLEITEQRPLGNAQAVAADCAALRARGFTFALDDVGIAYSHLVHMDAIQPKYLKVSQEFGSSFELHTTNTRIVRNVLSLAREFGCALILEGVETTATRDAARAEGIALAQGYLFSRPRPAATFV